MSSGGGGSRGGGHRGNFFRPSGQSGYTGRGRGSSANGSNRGGVNSRSHGRSSGSSHSSRSAGSQDSRDHGRGGGSSSNDNIHVVHNIGFQRLLELTGKPVDDVIMDLDKCGKNLSCTTTDPNIRDDFIIILVQLIGEKLCVDAPFPEIQNRLVAMVSEAKFLEKVKNYSLSLVISSQASSLTALSSMNTNEVNRSPMRFLQAQFAWYAFMNARMPDVAADLVLSNVESSVAALALLKMKTSQSSSVAIRETIDRLSGRFEQLKTSVTDFKNERDEKQNADPTQSSNRRHFKQKQLTKGDLERLYLMKPEDKFTDIVIVPSTNEILTEDEPFLRPNLVTGKYPSVSTYLDVQFRLLREDFVAPLRESIREYMSNGSAYERRKKKLPPGTIRFYQRVKLLKVDVLAETTVFLLQFELTRNLQRVKWDKSKRLLNGSLLLLTSDRFNTIFFATVARRDEKQLARDGTIGVTWEGAKPPDLYANMEFLMVECEVYFEAYRHTLKALQLMASLASPDFDKPLFQLYPMTKYIVDMSTDKVPPMSIYLAKCNRKLDFSMILSCNADEIQSMINYHEKEKEIIKQKEEEIVAGIVAEVKTKENQEFSIKPHFARPEDFNAWPKAEDIGLDEAQYLAFRSAITQELSLIQGPPGTGKTYIGLLIMKLLLSNPKIIWRAPKPPPEDDADLVNIRFSQFSLEGAAARLVELRAKTRLMAQEELIQSPILVVCYTNHALDQFLEGIITIMQSLQMEPDGNLVRVGGRSKVEALVDFSIQKQREYYQRNRLFDPSFASARFKARRELSELQNWRSDLKDIFKGLRNPQGIVNLRQLVSDREVNIEAISKYRENFPPNLNHILMSSASLPNWLGLTEQFFKYKNFDPTVQLRSWFRILAPFNNKKMEKSVDLPSDHGDLDPEDEDYDMEELMANRLDEEIVYEVDKNNQRRNVKISYAFAVYWGSDLRKKKENLEIELSLPGNQNDFGKQMDIQRQLGQLEAEEVYQKNRSIFVQQILDAYVDGRIELPEVTPALLQRAHQTQPPLKPSYTEKWAIYFHMLAEIRKCVAAAINETESTITEAQKKLAEINNHGDGIILKKAKVVGITTTGAAKYSQLLRMMKSRIVIIEEAAEVLEAAVVTSITEHCQHLILIGDHQQLRPTTTVYKLAKDFNLEISLFERLIKNNLSWRYLKAQHRMRPEICKLLVPTIYKELENHRDVMNYPDVMGMGKNLFFVTHNELEKADTDSMTKSNEYEARFITKLCRHLLLQGYKQSQITMLTTYVGQMFLIKKIVAREDHICQGVRVTVVDNFQGEENDIILLSLVRSNSENKIGFLATDNRINVALSRAKQGLYVIGNMSCMLASGSQTWAKIEAELKEQASISESVELKCQIHGHTLQAKTPEQFQLVSPEGGCTQMCPGILPDCDHLCRLVCHVRDRDHQEYKCKEPCQRKCPAPEKHDCPHMCWNSPCPCCLVPMDRKLPCDHLTNLPCHVNIETYPCPEIIEKDLLSCDHKAKMACSLPVAEFKCPVRVEKELTCRKHKKYLPCHKPVTEWICRENTVKDLRCGHPAEMKCCGDPSEIICATLTPRDMTCGHQQMARCSLDISKVFCENLVKITMPKCGHEVEIKCMTVEMPDTWQCTSRCDTRLPCGHSCRKKTCHIDDDPEHVYYKCQEPCAKKCPSGHPCKRKDHKCHQKCDPCPIKLDKILEACGHTVKVACSMDTSTLNCMKPCQRTLPCRHPCTKKCFEFCAPCMTPIERKSMDCDHMVKVECSTTPSRSRCTAPVPSITKGPCGHSVQVPCNVQLTVSPDDLLKYCHHPCGYIFAENKAAGGCSHTCVGDCSTCFQGRIHMKCNQKCERVLACGHICKFPCSKLCPPCNEPCPLICEHSTCKKQCGFPCTDCKEACTRTCPHKKCSRTCDEECDRLGCDVPCSLKLEKCGHECIGMCGEPCPSLCRICDKQQVEEIFFGTEDEEETRFVLLEDCNHVLAVYGMDEWMKTEVTGQIGVKQCPKCTTTILKSVRYKHILKRKMKDVLEVRDRIFGNAQKLINSQKKIMDILLVEGPEQKSGPFASVWRCLRAITCSITQKKRKKDDGWIDVISPATVDQYQFETVDNILTWLKEAEDNVKLKPLPQPNPVRLAPTRFTHLGAALQAAQAPPVIRQDLTDDCHKYLVDQYQTLFKILLNRHRPLTGREIFDFDQEFHRLNDLCRLSRRRGIEEFERYHGALLVFNTNKAHLMEPRPYDNNMQAQFTARLKQLDTVIKTGWSLMEKERKRGDIFQAMGMAANHWYRCVNGHLYTVGDCGALNQAGRCPECRAPIGGGSDNTHFTNGMTSEVIELTASVVTVPAPDFSFGESPSSS